VNTPDVRMKGVCGTVDEHAVSPRARTNYNAGADPGLGDHLGGNLGKDVKPREADDQLEEEEDAVATPCAVGSACLRPTSRTRCRPTSH
jgi:hypothetical protein